MRSMSFRVCSACPKSTRFKTERVSSVSVADRYLRQWQIGRVRHSRVTRGELVRYVCWNFVSSFATCAITWSQLLGSRCLKIRMLGYHGLRSDSRPHRHSLP